MKNILIAFIINCLCASLIISQEKWGSYDGSIAGSHFTLVEACGDSVEVSTGYWYERIRISQLNYTEENAGRRVKGDSVLFKYNLLDNSAPILLYDYSVELGDTINGLWGEFIVTAVDTEFAIGKERKRITMESTYDGHLDIWLSGLGSKMSGYIQPGAPLIAPDAGSEFSCYYNELSDEFYYGEKDPALCMITQTASACMTTSIKEEKFDVNIKIYPNPTQDFINIELENSNSTRINIQVLSLDGKQIVNKNHDGGNISLDMSDFAPGIYLLVLNQNGHSSNHKIVTQ